MLKIFPLALAAFCWSIQTYAQAPDQCLDAHLTLDDGQAMNSANNNYHGSAYGTVATFNRYSEPEKALLFNGWGSHILLNNGPPVITEGSFTISAWVKITGPGGGDESSNQIFSQRSSNESTDSEIDLYIKNDSIFFSVSPNNQTTYTATGVLTETSSWFHVHAVHEGDHMRIHVNGVEIGRQNTVHSNASFSGTDRVYIGYKKYLGTVYGAFSGLIDEVKIYDCALTPENVMNEHWLFTDELAINETELSLYPNPSTGQVFFNSSSINNKYEVFNLQGQLIESGNCQNQINLDYLPKGVYLIRINGLEYSESMQGCVILH